MAAITKPLRLDAANFPATYQSGDYSDITVGGTGANTAAGARTALGLAIGADIAAYSADTAALTALHTTTGIPARTATDTWAMRTITGSTRVSVANGGGVAGNPTIDMNAYADSGVGAFLKLTRDTNGFISGTTAVVLADVDALISGTYAKLANPAFTGSPTAPTQSLGDNSTKLATTAYVDQMVSAGVVPWDHVALATTGNITLSGEQTIDGVLTSATRVLVWQQSTPAQNGIYVSAAGAWARATDANATAQFEAGKEVYVSGGTAYTGAVIANTNLTAVTVGTTGITFTQINGTQQITAGAGLTKTGNTIDVISAASTRISILADSIDLGQPVIGGSGAAAGITKVTVDAYGRVTNTGAAVPSDIGAQPVATVLTNISALTGSGFVMMTATNTPVMRTLVSGGTIAVTNPAGVAGNPSIDLTGGIITPQTTNGVTVDQYGRVTALAAGSASEASLSPMTNGEAGSIVIGTPVYTFSSGSAKKANGNAAGTRLVIGLVNDVTVASGATANIATSGVQVATTAQWDAVTGQTGGLTPNATYYVSNVTAGLLTTTAPTTGYSCPIGIAMSTTRMKIVSWQPVQL